MFSDLFNVMYLYLQLKISNIRANRKRFFLYHNKRNANNGLSWRFHDKNMADELISRIGVEKTWTLINLHGNSFEIFQIGFLSTNKIMPKQNKTSLRYPTPLFTHTNDIKWYWFFNINTIISINVMIKYPRYPNT